MIYQSNLYGASTSIGWGVQTALTVSTTTLHVDVSDNTMVYLHTTHPIYVSFVKMNLLRAISTDATVRVILA